MKDFEINNFRPRFEDHIQQRERIELPCKDMDIDCLPDSHGTIPFGSYAYCFAYDEEQGLCPFLPFIRHD